MPNTCACLLLTISEPQAEEPNARRFSDPHERFRSNKTTQHIQGILIDELAKRMKAIDAELVERGPKWRHLCDF